MSCSCKKCIDCCYRNPGWFSSIEEVKGASKILGLSASEFCKKYLIREWWSGEEGFYIPSPRRNFNRKTKEKIEYDKDLEKREINTWRKDKDRNGFGFVIATWGHNLMSGYACIFLSEDDKCIIHESKPKECKVSFGCSEPTDFTRNSLLKYWKKNKSWMKSIVDSL